MAIIGNINPTFSDKPIYLFKICMLNAHISIFWGPPVTEFHSSLAGKVPSWLPVASVTADCSTNHLASGTIWPCLEKIPYHPYIIPIFLGQIQWNPVKSSEIRHFCCWFSGEITWNPPRKSPNAAAPRPAASQAADCRRSAAHRAAPAGCEAAQAPWRPLTLEPGRMVPGRC